MPLPLYIQSVSTFNFIPPFSFYLEEKRCNICSHKTGLFHLTQWSWVVFIFFWKLKNSLIIAKKKSTVPVCLNFYTPKYKMDGMDFSCTVVSATYCRGSDFEGTVLRITSHKRWKSSISIFAHTLIYLTADRTFFRKYIRVYSFLAFTSLGSLIFISVLEESRIPWRPTSFWWTDSHLVHQKKAPKFAD